MARWATSVIITVMAAAGALVVASSGASSSGSPAAEASARALHTPPGAAHGKYHALKYYTHTALAAEPELSASIHSEPAAGHAVGGRAGGRGACRSFDTQTQRWQGGKHVDSRWAPLCTALKAWTFDSNFAFDVGNGSGSLFIFEKGDTNMSSVLDMASSSKWPSATMLLGLVADGTMDPDAPLSRYLPYWSVDPEDRRSRVTLRHCLGFITGYEDHSNAGPRPDSPDPFEPPCANSSSANFKLCAEKLYHRANITYEPGTTWDYNSYHLQFAGAAATAAANLSIAQLYEKYLFDPLRMLHSSGCNTVSNPEVATCLRTTGTDYGRMLRAIMTRTLWSGPRFPQRALAEKIMYEDLTAPPNVVPDAQYAWEAEWFGHFGAGHWYECLDNRGAYYTGKDGDAGASYELSAECEANPIHANPGAFGYYPLIDVNRNYYMQVVVQEQTEPVDLTGVPEYLRIAAKPLVDAIMHGDNTTITPRAALAALTFEDMGSVIRADQDGLSSRRRRRAHLKGRRVVPP